MFAWNNKSLMSTRHQGVLREVEGYRALVDRGKLDQEAKQGGWKVSGQAMLTTSQTSRMKRGRNSRWRSTGPEMSLYHVATSGSISGVTFGLETLK